MTRTRTAVLCAATLIAATLPTMAGAATRTVARESHACVSSPKPARGEARRVLATAKRAKKELDLKSVLLRVTVNGRPLVTDALGESMTRVPAEPDMHFRAGSVGIAYLGTILLQLVEERKVRLDDPVSRWLPELPHAHRITLRMLGSSTSGLADYVTDPQFISALEAAPFRQWTRAEVVGISTGHPLLYRPGTNWSYSHANFQILGAALEKITHTRLDRLLEQRVTGPLRLRDTRNSYTPDIQAPVLHAFTAERGSYEESTFWNPSWTTAPGAVITTDICDLARSAQAIGAGELLSRRAYRVQLDPGTVGLGKATRTCPATVCLTNTEATHFGLGIIVLNGWIVQNPSFSGYAAIQAYLPAEHLAIAVATTKGPTTPDGNTAQTIAERIAAVLAPSHPLATH
ncbi:D-alanyl-D-alanine carboxypeptidase [Streptacidiphilus sp. MAP12-16]|uniref:serine hydrolase domain-containing protein n=1 Tax=Streptacidiphilus sp. MAP12-16 TaxID=3156300 RepID=UPI0035184439